ncbi:MAG: hypothetical protein ACK40X_07125 [Armatimonadota bacterium]
MPITKQSMLGANLERLQLTKRARHRLKRICILVCELGNGNTLSDVVSPRY